MTKIFKIVPDGAAYITSHTDLEFKCKECGMSVDKVYYSERTGIGEWICQYKHVSREKIGV